MELPKHWLTMPILDAEYKRYKLLAFLKYVDERYFERRLFPYMAQVKGHTEDLSTFIKAMEELNNSFPKELTGLDLEQLQMAYTPLVNTGLELTEIEKIVHESLPLLKNNLGKAYELVQELKEQIEAFTIGVLPLNVQYGYLMLQQKPGTRVYEYRLNRIENIRNNFGPYSISTRYIDTWLRSPSTNFEHIKLALIKGKNSVANPATFGFVSTVSLPPIETYLPLAKQMALEMMRSNSA